MTETQSLVFRRFDDVHVRLLLYLQDQIAQLEGQLRMVDEENLAETAMHNGTFRQDRDPIRVEIMERLRVLVGEYDIMVLAFSRMQETKASEKVIGRLREWIKKHTAGSVAGTHTSPTTGAAIATDELEWVHKADDLSNFAVATSISTTASKPTGLTRLLTGRKR
jgi:hypothetical protein